MPNKYSMRYELEFLITSYCQAKCPTCLRTKLVNKGLLTPTHNTVEHFAKAVSNVDSAANIVFCGEIGDPMMHPEIDSIIDLFLSNGNEISIHTNGGLRDVNFYKKYASQPITISWGIDGITEEANSKYRIGVNFERAWENMHTWFKNGGEGHWNFIVFEWNKHQLFDAYNHAKNNNIPIEIKINKRKGETSGYVGDEEYDRIAGIINELQ